MKVLPKFVKSSPQLGPQTWLFLTWFFFFCNFYMEVLIRALWGSCAFVLFGAFCALLRSFVFFCAH